MNSVNEAARILPVRAETDILVVGGGPAGLMAAQAACGEGRKVMLLESRSFLGGNLTLGLPILAFLDINGKQCIRGLAQRFIDRLREQGAATEHKRCRLHMSLTLVDPAAVRRLGADLMEECGVEVLMHVFAAGVVLEGPVGSLYAADSRRENAVEARSGRKVRGVVIESKAGREVILARTVIDCTGDGDIAALSGAQMHKGGADGGLQPPTLMYSMRGVDVPALRKAIVERPDEFDMDRMPPEQFREGPFITVGLRGRIHLAEAAGIPVPVARTILISGLRPDEIWVNMTRVNGVDPTRPESHTHGEIEALRQMDGINEYLRRFVPGFEQAWVDQLTPFLGIGSEVYTAIKTGRYGIGFELKESYFNEAIKNCRNVEVESHQPTLFG